MTYVIAIIILVLIWFVSIVTYTIIKITNEEPIVSFDEVTITYFQDRRTKRRIRRERRLLRNHLKRQYKYIDKYSSRDKRKMGFKTDFWKVPPRDIEIGMRKRNIEFLRTSANPKLP